MTKRMDTEHELARFMQNVLIWLGQPRWQVTIRNKKPGKKVWADTVYHKQRYAVELRISDYILKEADAELQLQVMLHEALHSIHVGIDRMMNDTHSLMHSYENEDLWKRYHQERELMVDALSLALMDQPSIKRLWKMSRDG